MIKSVWQNIKKYTLIAIIIVLIVAPITASVKLGVIQFVNTDDLAAISFNKRMFTSD